MFDGVRVPEGSRIGQEGDGFKIAMAALDGGRINIGACRWVGAWVGITLPGSQHGWV